MAFVTLLRALNAVGTVAEVTRVFHSAREASTPPNATVETDATDLERGLASVVVAALKEVFDRDRSRFELEREAREAAHARAEWVLRLEWLRQAATQSLSQVRLLASFSVTVWVVSAVGAAIWRPFPRTAHSFLDLGGRRWPRRLRPPSSRISDWRPGLPPSPVGRRRPTRCPVPPRTRPCRGCCSSVSSSPPPA